MHTYVLGSRILARLIILCAVGFNKQIVLESSLDFASAILRADLFKYDFESEGVSLTDVPSDGTFPIPLLG